jgi:hypothetical protein
MADETGTDADFVADHQCRQEFGAGAAAFQLKRRQQGRQEGCAGVPLIRR